jgi:tRNA threonylcarbamoyladenosine biosynthesis protein TsaB
MLVLAIDTALSACSVALVKDGQTMASRIEPMARGQAERLAPMVRDIMAEYGLAFRQIDRVAVTRGPGAFTGLRIGLAFARGLALALGRPCVGITTLEVLAYGASQIRTLAAIEVAGSLFVGAWEGRREILSPCRGEPNEILAQLSGDWSVTGPGAAAILARRPDWLHVAKELPDPALLGHLVAHLDPSEHPPSPLYLRGSGAKLAGGISLDEAG